MNTLNVISEVTLEQNGEMAVVRVSKEGRVEVERNGAVTVFRPQHTVERVIGEFKKRGWEEADVEVKAENGDNTKTEETETGIQAAIDTYLELHEQMSELKVQMDKLKKEIRTHMEDNKLKEVKGTNGKRIVLQDAVKSNSTSIYTDYELNDIMHRLEGEYLRQVTEIRVNAEKLEGLLKVGKLPEEKVKEIRNLKIRKPGTPRFTVRK